MATQIRPNRLEVSDRFPMLGFTVRTDGHAKRYEIAIGTSPDLFGPDGKSHRSRSNFYSTRAAGPLPIERGEAVYVLPPEVLARFVGQEKLYYGLATVGNGAGGTEVATMPGSGSPYINIGGLTGRSLQRVRLLPNRQRMASNYGKAGSEMDWAGDALAPGTQPATPPAAKGGTAGNGSSSAAPVHYDDGYGPLPTSPAPVAAPKPQLQAQAKSLADDIPLDPGVGGQSIGIDALQIGDIILSTTDHLTSTVIRAGSGSQVSHASLYVGQGGQVVEAVGGGVRLIPLAEAINDATVAVAFRVPGLSSDQRQQVADSIAAYIGRDYDYVGVVKQGLFQIDKRVCSVLPDGARQNCENWTGRIDLGRGSSTDFFCSSLITQAFTDAGVPITSRPPNWNSPQDLVDLAFRDGALQYVGHLKAPIPSKSLLDVFGLSLAAGMAEQKKDASPYSRRHHRFAHTQGVLDWATDRVADSIRDQFKSAQKKPFSFPKIRILDGDELQTLQHAMQQSALAGALGDIHSILAQGYSVAIGHHAHGGGGKGLVLTSDGRFGVFGDAHIHEGMFDHLAKHATITLVKGGVDAFSAPTVFADIDLGADVAGSIDVLGDNAGNVLGVAVGLRGAEEIGAFFAHGIGWAVQLFAEHPAPTPGGSAQALDADLQPAHLPTATRLSGPAKLVVRAAIDAALAAPMTPAFPALIHVVNDQGFSVGIGLGGDAGLLGGAGLGFGLILAPNNDIGVFGDFEIRAGLLAGLSADARVIVLRGGIDAFNETGSVAGITLEPEVLGVGIPGEVTVIALFNSQGHFHGVSFRLGVGEALSPVQIFMGTEKSVSAAVAQSLAAHAGAAGAGSAVSMPLQGQTATQPASTTSGVGDADDTTQNLNCIQGLTDKGRAISFVQRYLRSMSVAEATTLSNAGLQIVSCYEVGNPTKAAYFTRAQGQQDGRLAFTQAQRVGQPAGTPIYFAVDYDPGPGNRQSILDYFEGIQEGCSQYLADMQAQGTPGVVYDIGVYGSGCVLDWCQAQGIATWYWQAFAPGWCNNRQVWLGANLHTTGLDTPVRCGLRLDHLEGWGNEGGWTYNAAAQGQALSVRLPAPPPKRKYARGQAVDTSPRLIANSPVNTTTGGEGNITWELDQFPGVKMASQSAVAPLQSAETIELSNWPYCDHANGTRASAWFTVDWKFSGQALGQVRITPAGTQQGAQPLRIEARIEDGTNRDATTTSLVVRFAYHFSTADGPDVVALTELKLYSDGSIDQNSNWTSRVAA
jgi:hypothetical protein